MSAIDGKELTWTRKYPELGTDAVPIEPCWSPAYFELERERIFRHTWLNVGRVEELPSPGDYYVRELAVCRTSVLVMRGRNGNQRLPQHVFTSGQQAGLAAERQLSRADLQISRLDLRNRRETHRRAGRKEFLWSQKGP